MAAGGVDVEETQMEPQQFPQIVKLWEKWEELYPRRGNQKDYSGDELLKLLESVLQLAKKYAEECKAHNEGGPKPGPPPEVACDEENGGLFDEENSGIAELLSLSGWKREGKTWCLAEYGLQIASAAHGFADNRTSPPKAEAERSDFYGGACEVPEDPMPQEEAGEELVLTDDQIDEMIRRLLDRSTVDNTSERMPSARDTKAICFRARQVLIKEPNVLEVGAPATLVGDIHGQFWDLLHQVFGEASGKALTLEDFKERKFVFLGDFVDRGEYSLLCLDLILLLKIKYPDNIFLLRGNHESRITNNMYGFHEECRTNYPKEAINHDDGEKGPTTMGFQENSIWYLFNHLFDAMPLAALVGGRVFCCHGGLSPQLDRLDEILNFDRVKDIVPPGPMADITWSDPGMCEGWRINARGSGYLFGEDISKEFCQKNNLMFICRAHQCVREGYRWDHDKRVVTVFSAPNYCWQQNKGAILNLGADLEAEFKVYDCWTRPEQREDDSEQKPSEYFSAESDEAETSSPKAAEEKPAEEDE